MLVAQLMFSGLRDVWACQQPLIRRLAGRFMDALGPASLLLPLQ